MDEKKIGKNNFLTDKIARVLVGGRFYRIRNLEFEKMFSIIDNGPFLITLQTTHYIFVTHCHYLSALGFEFRSSYSKKTASFQYHFSGYKIETLFCFPIFDMEKKFQIFSRQKIVFQLFFVRTFSDVKKRVMRKKWTTKGS